MNDRALDRLQGDIDALPEREPIVLWKNGHTYIFHWSEESTNLLGVAIGNLVNERRLSMLDVAAIKIKMDWILNADLE